MFYVLSKEGSAPMKRAPTIDVDLYEEQQKEELEALIRQALFFVRYLPAIFGSCVFAHCGFYAWKFPVSLAQPCVSSCRAKNDGEMCLYLWVITLPPAL
jgi:hypothetical protein